MKNMACLRIMLGRHCYSYYSKHTLLSQNVSEKNFLLLGWNVLTRCLPHVYWRVLSSLPIGACQVTAFSWGVTHV